MVAVLGLSLGLLAAAPGGAAEAEKNEKSARESQAQVEQKLEAARKRLDEAAREVADLSMSMSEYAVPAMSRTIRFGAQRAMLGINLGSRGSEKSPDGVEIVSVSPGGAAQSAGLKAGDLLIEVNGKSLKREGDEWPRDRLLSAMKDVKPGDKVALSYRRDGKVAKASVVAQPIADRMFTMAMPAMPGRVAVGGVGPLPPFAFMRAEGVFGSAELVPLTPKLGQYFGTDKGLLVVRAPPDSRLKLEDGDVIVDIDGRTPASPAHAFRILGSYQSGEQLKLNVLRQKKRMTFEITVPDSPWERERAHFIRGRDLVVPPPGAEGPDVIFGTPAMPPDEVIHAPPGPEVRLLPPSVRTLPAAEEPV
jgi:type II secretory pathway component PulC